MEPLRRSRWSIAGATVALLAIVTLGNLRGIASELGSDAKHPEGTTIPNDQLVAAMAAAGALGRDEDGGATSDVGHRGVEEQAQLVPAIYAWDPDVRFVYYRHVSKWM